MPTYEYQCDQCHQIFEVRQKFADEPLTIHEECGGAVHRLLSAPALQFKGSGFYITDYAKGSGGGPGNKSTSGSNESSEKSADKGNGDKGHSDKGAKDKGSSEKSSGDKGGGEKSSSSSTSTSSSSDSKPSS